MIPANTRTRQRRFGQNFLIDENVIDTLVSAITCGADDHLIEIGPGKGALTEGLLRKCGRVIAIEIDSKWVEYLTTRSQFKDLNVIKADASSINTQDLIKGIQSTTKPILVGNLPYNKAGPIFKNFIPKIREFQYMYFMVQLEVAKRMAANPHTRDFGALSVFIQNYADVELMRKIPPEAFRPRPKVYSATVKITAKEKPCIEDPLFFKFIKIAFAQKRKQIINSLGNVCSKNIVTSCLEDLKISSTARPEEIPVIDFVQLYHTLKSKTELKLF